MPLFVTQDTVAAIVARHCSSCPSNDGAVRLLWWLADREPFEPKLWWMLGAPKGTTERLLSGELVPGEELAARIEEVTGRAVLATDWERSGAMQWRDRPVSRVH